MHLFVRSCRHLLVLSVGPVLLLAGCQDVQVSQVYNSALLGALAGVIIGHQSDEDAAGAAVGAAIFGTQNLLAQLDENSSSSDGPGCSETVSGSIPSLEDTDGTEPVTIYIRNSDGSTKPIQLRRQGGYYVGPKGEYYEGLPSPDLLKHVYGS